MSVNNVVVAKFESSVNSEGIETAVYYDYANSKFESSVNSEGIETLNQHLPIC